MSLNYVLNNWKLQQIDSHLSVSKSETYCLPLPAIICPINGVMEQRKRVFTFLTFFVCTACLAFLTASLATHKWIVAKPVRSTQFLNTSLTFNESLSDSDHDSGKFRGEIHFGLFQGTKLLNYGFGDRITAIWSEYSLLIYSYL